MQIRLTPTQAVIASPSCTQLLIALPASPSPCAICSRRLQELGTEQGTVAKAVGALQTDVAAHGAALQGVGKTCLQLLSAVQSLAGTAGGFQGSLQALLAGRNTVTGGACRPEMLCCKGRQAPGLLPS